MFFQQLQNCKYLKDTMERCQEKSHSRFLLSKSHILPAERRVKETLAQQLYYSGLDFYYHHLNINNEISCGKCHSIPKILDNGKLEMKENWQWLNGDLSKGKSLLIEI